jgi:hypothetical protein
MRTERCTEYSFMPGRLETRIHRLAKSQMKDYHNKSHKSYSYRARLFNSPLINDDH